MIGVVVRVVDDSPKPVPHRPRDRHEGQEHERISLVFATMKWVGVGRSAEHSPPRCSNGADAVRDDKTAEHHPLSDVGGIDSQQWNLPSVTC